VTFDRFAQLHGESSSKVARGHYDQDLIRGGTGSSPREPGTVDEDAKSYDPDLLEPRLIRASYGDDGCVSSISVLGQEDVGRHDIEVGDRGRVNAGLRSSMVACRVRSASMLVVSSSDLEELACESVSPARRACLQAAIPAARRWWWWFYPCHPFESAIAVIIGGQSRVPIHEGFAGHSFIVLCLHHKMTASVSTR